MTCSIDSDGDVPICTLIALNVADMHAELGTFRGHFGSRLNPAFLATDVPFAGNVLCL